MVKNHEWIKKSGEDWYVLKMKDLSKLSLEGSLKVQEMFDNKTHQQLERKFLKEQSKFNKILIMATLIIAMSAGAVFFNVGYETLGVKSNLFTTIVFSFVFLLLAISIAFLAWKK